MMFWTESDNESRESEVCEGDEGTGEAERVS
jgi:hypothetical protein